MIAVHFIFNSSREKSAFQIEPNALWDTVSRLHIHPTVVPGIYLYRKLAYCTQYTYYVCKYCMLVCYFKYRYSNKAVLFHLLLGYCNALNTVKGAMTRCLCLKIFIEKR